jgi:class 3 adenylate cyclase/predicted ATPase
MAEDIAQWLDRLGLGQYAQAFAENGVELQHLPHLTDDDLKELGLPLGPRRHLQAAIETLSADQPSIRPTVPSAQEPEARPADAERRQLTVMFCDLVGSTELSHQLDPEELREVMRRYQDAVVGSIARYEGYIAKYLGDGVLAYFGWPRAYEDQAERAVRAGLDAITAMEGVKLESDDALQARVGIATGQVVIGDIVGEAAAQAEAVVGETPNLAARLQGVAAPGQVVIGSTTRLLIGETFKLKDLGAHQLKGFPAPVAAWRVIGESAAESRFEAAHPGALSQLVGREHELGLLRRAWEQSRSGIGQVVLVSGEPGIGKSRLVDALGAELKAEGCTQINLGCSPYHANSALYPLIVHLERVLRWQREDSAEEKLAKLEEALQDFSLALDGVIPLFAALLSLALPEDRYPPLNFTPQQQKQQTLDATVAWLLEEAERQPVLQVWEDLHWADPSTLELLRLEIEQAPTAPILNVLTFRPEFTPPWPHRSHMTPLTLNRLQRPEVEALITQQAVGKALPSEVVEHIINRTDGVPLYVEELTKAILETDILRERDDAYELTGPLSEVTIPASLQDSLMARLDRLPTIREVAQLGAILGREFAYEMLQAIASMEETTLQKGLDQLVDAELLYQRGRPPRAKYIFKHALVQDAAYQSLLKRTRQYYHRQVAELLAARFPETTEAHPELVAHHFTEAACFDQAVSYWQKAGQRSIARSANAEAVSHLSRGLELLKELPETPERTRQELGLQVPLAAALLMTKGQSAREAAAAYARARELCGQLEDTPELCPVLFGLWRFYLARPAFRTAGELGEQLLRLAERGDEPSHYVLAHYALGLTALYSGELSAASAHFEEVIARYTTDQSNSPVFRAGNDPGVSSRAWTGLTLWLLGYPEQAEARSHEALALTRELAHPYSLAFVLWVAALVSQFRRDVEFAHAQAEESVNLSTEHGFALWLGIGTILLGRTQVAQGKLQEGVEQMRQGLVAYRATGANVVVPRSLTLLAEGYGATGQVADALRVLAEAQVLVDGNGEHWCEAEVHRCRGELLLARSVDAHSEAETCFRQALDVARRQQAKSLELRAAMRLSRLWQQQGKQAEARDLLGPIYGWFTEGFHTPDLKDAKALLDDLA